MITETLRELVGIDSVYPNERRLAAHLKRALEGLGFSARLHEFERGRFNVMAQRGNGRKLPMFYGHMDTVPVYGRWDTDPFMLTKRGDRLFGLGACDMKGGIAAMLESAAENRDTGMKVLLCSDEEYISTGAWRAVERQRNWFRDVSFVLSGEPGASKRSTGGSGMVTLGRRGRVTVCVDVEGLSYHGAMAEMGINAIDEASKIVLALGELQLAEHRQLGREGVFASSVSGGATSLSVPDRAHVELSMHIVPPTTIRGAVRKVDMLVRRLHVDGRLHRGARVRVALKERSTPYIPPFVDDLRNPHIGRILEIVGAKAGRAVVNYASSVGDDNVMATGLGVPVVIVGPKGGNIHSRNEWVSERDLAKVAGLYGAILSSRG